MNYFIPRFIVLSSILVLGTRLPLLAIEEHHDILVRNGLTRPVQFEISNNTFSDIAEKSNIQPRWEINLKGVKVESLSDRLDLGVKIRDSASENELSRCQATLPKSVNMSRITVIIYQQSSGPRCDIVDLNAFSSVSTFWPQPDKAINRVAMIHGTR